MGQSGPTIFAALWLVSWGGAAAAQGSGAPQCLRAVDVDHTKTPDEHTILFYMKDGNVWRTTLKADCPELRFNGFDYGVTPPDDICASMQTIRVLKSGAICEIGPFVPASR